MSVYTRAPLNFKAALAIKRDELVLRGLVECTPALAIDMLESARAHLLIGTLTTGDLDGVVLLFNHIAALREGL